MLSLAVVLEIRRLLDEDELTQREIAVRIGVSRSTVCAVASGRRAPDLGSERPFNPRRNEPKRLPQRCSTCGGLVFAPCRLCRVRGYRDRMELVSQFSQSTSRQSPHDPRRAA